MPKLLHLNNLDNKINKRIVEHMIKQASQYLPDVPAPAISEDVTQNYNSLMKSLSNILLNLQEIYMARFEMIPEGEADYEEYQFGDGESEASFGVPGSAMASSVGSAYGSELANPRLYPLRSPSQSERLSQYEAPSRDEERLARNERNQNNPFSSLVLNSLSKEIINAKFLTEVIPFPQLTKIQKQKLKQIIVRINKVIGVIRTGVAKPIYINLVALVQTITAGFKSTEGDYQEYLPRTEGEMPPEQAGEFEALVGHGHICGSTTSVYGAGRKHRLLSPAMYAAHNVNDLFHQSLSKRNR
jgi:hypothetical protein